MSTCLSQHCAVSKPAFRCRISSRYVANGSFEVIAPLSFRFNATTNQIRTNLIQTKFSRRLNIATRSTRSLLKQQNCLRNIHFTAIFVHLTSAQFHRGGCVRKSPLSFPASSIYEDNSQCNSFSNKRAN